MSPIRPNAIWAMDFQFDETRDGKQLKLLNIQDIFTRECLAVATARFITADDATTLLDELVAQHGVPAYLRCDNGPEFAALPLLTGVGSMARRRRSSIRVHPGRTVTSSRSTHDYAMSFSTAISSSHCSKLKCSSRAGDTNTIMNVSTVLSAT
jgi:transposase InsO family protein